ncbi:MAG: pilus assembly protein [Chloroflexi bacterium]|nr:pilus assembly protein [Chloroflexota bacterium]
MVDQRKAMSQRGQTLLELALVGPLRIFFILALVDFGIAIDRRLVLDHAVREGARYASVGADSLITGVPGSKAQVQAHAFDQAQQLPVDLDAIEVCYRALDADQAVEVSIDYTYQLVTPIAAIANLAPGFSIPLFAKASARVEQPLTGVLECS